MPQKCLRLQSKTARTVLIGILQPSLTFLCKNDMTPAMRGTAAHHFLEVCDLDMGAQSVEKETKGLFLSVN